MAVFRALGCTDIFKILRFTGEHSPRGFKVKKKHKTTTTTEKKKRNKKKATNNNNKKGKERKTGI